MSDLFTFDHGWLILLFGVVIVLFLIFDLGVFNKKDTVISFRKALWMSIFWVAVSLIFAVLIYIQDGSALAIKFVTAYVVEKSLSLDNIFVFILLFNFFNIEEKYYHKILFWGILGAIVFRMLFISLGVIIVSSFHWVLYIFGVILIITGYKMLRSGPEDKFNPADSMVYRFLKNRFRFTNEFDHTGKFAVRKDGKLFFTTLFMVLILIEVSDIVFAIDSIPAVFAITQDPFIIYTSNIFAIMGLRAMFFLLSGSLPRFPRLKDGISFILMYIGVKMLLEYFDFHVPAFVSLGIIISVLTASILFSWIETPKDHKTKN